MVNDKKNKSYELIYTLKDYKESLNSEIDDSKSSNETEYTPETNKTDFNQQLNTTGLSVVIDNISYKPSKAVVPYLHRISFVARSGCITGVLGLAKSGKTLLLKSIAGRYPCTKNDISGHIYCVSLTADPRLPQYVSFIAFKESFCPFLTILEYLSFVVRLVRTELDNHEQELIICRSLKDVKLWPYRNEFIDSSKLLNSIDHSSKRLSLAIALVRGSKIIVIDEVVSSYDSKCSYSFILLLKLIAAKYQCCIICSQSRLHHKTLDLYDQLVILHQGTMIYAGQPHLIVPYFEEISPLKLPVTWTPIEFVMDIASKTYHRTISIINVSESSDISGRSKKTRSEFKRKQTEQLSLGETFAQSLVYQEIRNDIQTLHKAGPQLMICEKIKRPFKLVECIKKFCAIIERKFISEFRGKIILFEFLITILSSLVLLIVLSWNHIPQNFEIQKELSKYDLESLTNLFVLNRTIEVDDKILFGLLRIIDLGPRGDGVNSIEYCIMDSLLWERLETFEERVRIKFNIPDNYFNFRALNNLKNKIKKTIPSTPQKNGRLTFDRNYILGVLNVLLRYIQILYHFMFVYNVKPFKRCVSEITLCNYINCLKMNDSFLFDSLKSLIYSYQPKSVAYFFDGIESSCQEEAVATDDNFDENNLSALPVFDKIEPETRQGRSFFYLDDENDTQPSTLFDVRSVFTNTSYLNITSEKEVIARMKNLIKHISVKSMIEMILGKEATFFLTYVLNWIQESYSNHSKFPHYAFKILISPLYSVLQYIDNALNYLRITRHIQMIIQFTITCLSIFIYIFVLKTLYFRKFFKYEQPKYLYNPILDYIASSIFDGIMILIPASIISLVTFYICELYLIKNIMIHDYFLYWLTCYLTIFAASSFGILLVNVSPNEQIAALLVPITFFLLSIVAGFPIRTFFPTNSGLILKVISFYYWSYNSFATIIFYKNPIKSGFHQTIQMFTSNARGIPYTVCMSSLVGCIVFYRLFAFIIHYFCYRSTE